MGNFLKNRRLLSGSSGVVLPTGSTAQRPDFPVFGLIRYNTDSGLIEFFDGSIFQSLTTSGGISYTVDSFTGDGSTTVFTMSEQESDAEQIIVFVGSIYHTTDPVSYTVNGGYDITFESAPPNGIPINVIHTNG
jgi:hypothetical protein